MALSTCYAALAFLVGASLLAIGQKAEAQRSSDISPLADSTGESDVYPVGDAVGVYRAVLDLLYVDGKNRPSVIVLWDRAQHPVGGPCAWRCTEPWPHQSTIDTSTILAFTQQSLKRPRIIDFGYKTPIERVSESGFDRIRQLGYGYLAHLPPGKVGHGEAFWEGFKRRFPGAWGRVVLGKVGFNVQHTQALIRVLQACGMDCHSTETFFLKRAGKEWKVIERVVDPFESSQASGSLRYRGPTVAPGMGYRSQIVAADVPDTLSGVQSVEAGKTTTFSGVYTSGAWENVFSPCNVQGIGSGWAVRFKNPAHGGFLRYEYPRPGGPPVSHFIRVRGRVSAPGRFGIGFQAREIVVDSVLHISESPQPCPSYEDLPHPWTAIAPTGSSTVGAAVTQDGTLVATLDQDAIIRIRDVPRGALVRQFPALDTGRLERVCRWHFPPMGNWLPPPVPMGSCVYGL